MARDSAPVARSSILHCYINIGDVNDNSPMTEYPIYYTSVPENSSPGTAVARLEAFDPDAPGAQLTYKITAGNPQNFFTIDEKSGESGCDCILILPFGLTQEVVALQGNYTRRIVNSTGKHRPNTHWR